MEFLESNLFAWIISVNPLFAIQFRAAELIAEITFESSIYSKYTLCARKCRDIDLKSVLTLVIIGYIIHMHKQATYID